ncbi:MAG: major capsid protein [Desulfovibrionaceae bacterium]
MPNILPAENMFSVMEMTEAINKLPLMPLRMAPLFRQRGVRTTSVAMDIKNGRLVLVSNQDRRAAPQHMAGRGTKRQTVTLPAAHLPLMDSLLPDDVQNVRSFGTSEPIGVESVINDKLLDLKNSIEMTVEFHRIGAIKGVVYDSDGTTLLYDLFRVFDVTKNTGTITFPTGASTTKKNPILKGILDAKRKAQQKLGGLPISRFEALIGSDFYDLLTGHELVRKPFEDWQANQANWGDNDYRKRGFVYGGVTWIEASEVINGRSVVDTTKAHMYPVGLGCFDQFNAPANWTDTANTIGQPFYAQMEQRDMQRGYDVEVQANPLCVCNVPEALVELTATEAKVD